MKNLGIGFWISVVAGIIVIAVFVYLGFRYSKCKKEENKPCDKKLSERIFTRTATIDPDFQGISMDVSNRKTIKCNFWKGKICEKFPISNFQFLNPNPYGHI